MTAESRDGRILTPSADTTTSLRDAARAVVEWVTYNGRGEARLPVGYVNTLRAALDRAEARPPEGLDAAWAAAEAVLETRAEGSQWELRVGHFTPSSTYWADGSYLEMYPDSIVTEGSTPAAALHALATRLSARGAEPR